MHARAYTIDTSTRERVCVCLNVRVHVRLHVRVRAHMYAFTYIHVLVSACTQCMVAYMYVLAPTRSAHANCCTLVVAHAYTQPCNARIRAM